MDKKVLLVADDEEMNRKVISKFLKDSFEVVEAENGAIAWDILNSRRVDVLLLDIIMPEMDGLEVLKHLKEDKKFDHVGVLVATSTKEKTERTALSLGADDVVAKPYDPLVIRKRLENIIVVKSINDQKDFLLNKDTEAFLDMKKKEINKTAGAIVEKIKVYTTIINANKDNFKLVAEITAEIDQQTDKLLALFAE